MFKATLLFALPLLAGCATVADAAPADPKGRWTFISIDGAKPKSDKAALQIKDDRIGATVGCNGMGAGVRIEPARLNVLMLISTKMYCDGLMDQETAVSQLLSSSPSYAIEGGRLKIRGGGHSAELVKASTP